VSEATARWNEEQLSALCERPVAFFEVTGSTNAEARRLAEAGADSGTLVVADAQSEGRGRLGRRWASPPGLNLYFTLILRPPIRPEEAPLLSLATGVAMAEGLDLYLKWPNDILDAEDRKVSGILSEVETSKGGVVYALLGIGLNVHQREFPGLPQAGSLANLGRESDRSELLARLVPRIESACALVGPDPARVIARWEARSAMKGRRVRVGHQEGEAVGLREDGALLLATDDGLVPVWAGDVEGVAT
jgi:BirA family biotin operon repressor/biotin-[acetyl-CoA-carboxylase] ligase